MDRFGFFNRTAQTSYFLLPALLWLVTVAAAGAATTPTPRLTRGWSFESGAEGWRPQGCRRERSLERAAAGSSSLKLLVDFPFAASVTYEGVLGLERVGRVVFSCFIPEEAPRDVRVLFFTKDKDGLYFQHLHGARIGRGQWQTLEVDLTSGSADLAPENHYSAWNTLAASRMNLIGIKFVCDQPYSGGVYLDQITLQPAAVPEEKLRIIDFRDESSRVEVYQKFEIAFQLNREFPNPFDPDQVQIDALFRSEVSGKTFRVPAFWYQDYLRSEGGTRKEAFRVEEANKEVLLERQEVLTPIAPPCWKVRFTPIEPGEHSYTLLVKAGSEILEARKRTFTAVRPDAPRSRGFVRICKSDPRYFEFDNGEFFYPIGHNVRSPFDERWWVVVLKEDRLPPDRGTYTYEDVLRKMRENGENFVEIWMSSWWLAIEWNREWRGFHGLTNYNLETAWKLDTMLALADRYDLYYHLVIDNHGKASTWCDPEWDENPYNADNGGPVEDVEAYFSNREAMRAFRKTLRYLVGRWAYHPRLMGLELWSELDLTGNGWDFVNHPVKTQWHQEVGRHLRELDPWDHLVTTHFSTDYSRVDPQVASLPEIDYVVVDAYRQKGSIVPLLINTYQACGVYGKPTFVTEYGGSPWATSADQVIPLLKADLHGGLWATFMTPTASTPLLWWFEFIDHQNQYFQFKALASFARGEDRRNKGLEMASASLMANPASLLRLGVSVLKNRDTAYLWIYDRMSMEQWPPPGEEPRFREVKIIVPDLKPGEYRTEVWNTMTGVVLEAASVKCNGSVVLALPEFTLDCAVKIKPKE
ncbi:MAG: DUF5060 domain-containing protein [Planctomycetes bacterium]|nr:DUF5060 domain-containing protein [Planctomycetota bacterium]